MFEEVINYLFREHSVMNVSPLLNNSFVRSKIVTNVEYYPTEIKDAIIVLSLDVNTCNALALVNVWTNQDSLEFLEII